MKKSIKLVLGFLVVGLVISAQPAFSGWASAIVRSVRVVKTTAGKSICIIRVTNNDVIGFEIATSSDEKMVDIALDALNSKTLFWYDWLYNLPSFTLLGDSAPYYTAVTGVSVVVSTRP